MNAFKECTRVLVTGSEGLLGSALVPVLRDLLPAAAILTPRRSELDLADASAVAEYWRDTEPDAVFHLAAYVLGLGGNLAAGSTAFTANARMNHNTLMACLDQPPRVVFVAGTVASYQYPYARLPLVEADAFVGDPHDGEYFYGLAKRAAWPYLQAIARAGDCSVTMGLFTNMYGPGDNFNESSGHVVPSLVKRFVDAVRAGADEVGVWGSPNTTRDFLYVQDAARALVTVVQAGVRLCNLASGRETTMGELVSTITKATGFTGRVVWDSSKPIGIPRRSVDNARLLAVAPATSFQSLEDGIAQTVQWYRAHSNGSA